MNYSAGMRRTALQLWNENYTREFELVDEILRPWVRERITEGIPAGRMLDHHSTAELLAKVAEWCLEYTKWRLGSDLPFFEDRPVERWGHRVPSERRPGVLFRVADHLEGQGEADRAWRLRRWGLLALLDEYGAEMGKPDEPPATQ